VCFVVCKTISELEHVILTTLFLSVQKTPTVGARGRGHLQRAFPLDVPMVSSLNLSFLSNGNNLTGVGLAPGETIRFGSFEFTMDHLGCLSLSPMEWDSGTFFIGMVPPQAQGEL
jgi:hypothetical protein